LTRPPATRTDLRRALALNALTKPVNVLVPAGVLVAGALLGAVWLAVVAVVCWVALSASTFFDAREARRVGERVRAARRRDEAPARRPPLTPEIRRRVMAAIATRDSIQAALEASRSPLAGVSREVDALVAAIEADAVRAQRIHSFLDEESPAELERRIGEEARAPVREALEAKARALTRLQERLDRLLAEMDHAITAVQTVHAEILAADDLDHGIDDGALADQVSELRAKVQIMSTGLDEALAETRVGEGVRSEP
jgi:chromosome segregation ATPase